MIPETLATMAGILLSLIFSYIPGLSDWYARLDGAYKRLLMLGALLAAAGFSLAAACLGWAQFFAGSGWGLPDCSQTGLGDLLRALLLALVANQTTYLITPRKSNHAGNGRSLPQG